MSPVAPGPAPAVHSLESSPGTTDVASMKNTANGVSSKTPINPFVGSQGKFSEMKNPRRRARDASL